MHNKDQLGFRNSSRKTSNRTEPQRLFESKTRAELGGSNGLAEAYTYGSNGQTYFVWSKWHPRGTKLLETGAQLWRG